MRTSALHMALAGTLLLMAGLRQDAEAGRGAFHDFLTTRTETPENINIDLVVAKLYAVNTVADYPGARAMLAKAVAQGNDDAKLIVAAASAFGLCGYPRDLAAAKRLVAEALPTVSAQGKEASAAGRSHAGACLALGLDGPGSVQKGLSILVEMHNADDAAGAMWLGALTNPYTPQHAAVDYAASYNGCARAANLGCGTGKFNLGLCYGYGVGTPKNEARFFELMQEAARMGVPDAVGSLGMAYAQGIGTPKNPAKGMEMMTLAQELEVTTDNRTVLARTLQYMRQHGNQIPDQKSLIQRANQALGLVNAAGKLMQIPEKYKGRHMVNDSIPDNSFDSNNQPNEIYWQNYYGF